MNNIEKYHKLLVSTLSGMDLTAVEKLSEAFLETYQNGGNIYTMGNGGSGASASHAAGDFLKGASFGLDRRFKMICLNDNLPSMMAIANDIGWDAIFEEPLKNFLQPHDLVIGISGSGNSKNVVNAINYAKSKGAKTAALTGFKGGAISKIADISVHIDVMDMEVTEDAHMAVFNMVKKDMMQKLMGDNPSMGDVYDSRVL